ncbi:hypothetical protein BDV10DRAFT_132404 [Aspergillus recurvatus]
MEAFAVAASVIQVAGAGLALAQVLYSLCDDASSSSNQMKDLAFHVQSTSTVLEEIGKIFKDEDGAERPIISQNAMRATKDMVDRCTVVFNELQEVLEQSKQSALGLVRFMMKTPRLRVLQLGLGEMRSNLQCMMQVIIYARLKAEPRNTFDENEHRELIKELIRDHLTASEQYRRANSHRLAYETTERASQRSDITVPQGNTGASQPTGYLSSEYGDAKNLTPVVVQGPDPADVPISPRNLESSALRVSLELGGGRGVNEKPASPTPAKIHCTEPQPADSAQSDLYSGITYASALYLVCCPCLARRRKQQEPALRVPVVQPTNDAVNLANDVSNVSASVPRYGYQHKVNTVPNPRAPGYTRSDGPLREFPDGPLELGPSLDFPEIGAIEVNSRQRRANRYHKMTEPLRTRLAENEQSASESDVDKLVHEWTTLYQ